MMKQLRQLFSKPKPVVQKPGQSTEEQAVLVHLDAVNLSPEVYENYDLAMLEDQFNEALQENGSGEVDGNEIGEGEAIIFIYGANADKIFADIEPILRGNPLCQNARIRIRYGSPGSPERVARIE